MTTLIQRPSTKATLEPFEHDQRNSVVTSLMSLRYGSRAGGPDLHNGYINTQRARR